MRQDVLGKDLRRQRARPKGKGGQQNGSGSDEAKPALRCAAASAAPAAATAASAAASGCSASAAPATASRAGPKRGSRAASTVISGSSSARMQAYWACGKPPGDPAHLGAGQQRKKQRRPCARCQHKPCVAACGQAPKQHPHHRQCEGNCVDGDQPCGRFKSGKIDQPADRRDRHRQGEPPTILSDHPTPTPYIWIGLPVTAIAASFSASAWVGWAWQV